jgi:DNA-binding IclR family transcriptional regulator
MAITEQNSVLRALAQSEGPLVLEEIAALAGISYEQAWYAVMEFLELRLVTPAGMGLFVLTRRSAEQSSAA